MRHHPSLGDSLQVYPKKPNASSWEELGIFYPHPMQTTFFPQLGNTFLEKYLLIPSSLTDCLGSMNRYGEQTPRPIIGETFLSLFFQRYEQPNQGAYHVIPVDKCVDQQLLENHQGDLRNARGQPPHDPVVPRIDYAG